MKGNDRKIFRLDPEVVSMELSGSGLAGAIACRPSSSSLLLHRVSPGLSAIARSSARLTTTILCSASLRPCVNVASIHALDPDFYKIPYVDGVPVGKRLKLWNLPPNCKHSELLEWFAGVNVIIESLELTNDPALTAQGVGGFVEFATKQDACIAIVRLDGYKFRGHYIRMDFAERRPRPNYGSRRSRPNQNSSSRGSSVTSSCPPVRDMASSNARMSSSISQSTARYDASVTSTIPPSSELGRNMGPQSGSPSGKDFQRNPAYENAQSSPGYGTTVVSTNDYVGAPSSIGHGKNINEPNSDSAHGPFNSLSMEASPGPGTTLRAPHYGVTRQDFSHVSASITSTVQASSDPVSIPRMGPQSSSRSGEGIQHYPVYGNVHSSRDYGTTLASTRDCAVTTGHGNNSSSSSEVPMGSLNTKALTGPGFAAEAPSFVVAKQSISGVEDGSPAEAVSSIFQILPPSPYANDGRLDHRNVDPYDDPFNGYGFSDQAMVEPWSNKIRFRSGPMYGSPEPSSFSRLFIGNMDLSVDDATLQQLFSRFGTVLEAKVLRDPESGRSRGLGVVGMSSAQEVKAAFKALDGWCLENRPLKVDAVAL